MSDVTFWDQERSAGFPCWSREVFGLQLRLSVCLFVTFYANHQFFGRVRPSFGTTLGLRMWALSRWTGVAWSHPHLFILELGKVSRTNAVVLLDFVQMREGEGPAKYFVTFS